MNGKEKTQIQGGAGRGWDFGSDFISGMGIHIPSRLEFGTGMGNDHAMWDGNGIRVPRPKPAQLPTLHPRVFCELTGCQRTPRFWGVTTSSSPKMGCMWERGI